MPAPTIAEGIAIGKPMRGREILTLAENTVSTSFTRPKSRS